MKTRIALCWAIGVLALSALLYGNARTRPTEVEARPVPLPEIAHQPIRLRVAHAINPRLPRLSAEQIAETLALARADARSTFAVELEFEPVVEIPIGDLFDRIPRRLTRSLRGEKVAPEVVSRYVEVVLLHELGHQLFHYADLFDVPACVMQPVRLLRFWESAFTVVPDGCPKSHPQMQRGAAAMYYWPSWEN